MTLRPKDVTTQLGISPATLRLWSQHFASFLSPSAQAALTEKGTPAQRRYTEEDFSLFVGAKALLDRGFTYQQVVDRLAESPVQSSEVMRTNGALPETAVAITESQNGHLDLGELVALVQRQNELQEQILLALTTRPPSFWERIKLTLGF